MTERVQHREIIIDKTIRPNGSHVGGEVRVRLSTARKNGTVHTPLGNLNVRRQEQPPGFLLRGKGIDMSLTGEPVFIPDTEPKPDADNTIRISQGAIPSGEITIKDFLQ